MTASPYGWGGGEWAGDRPRQKETRLEKPTQVGESDRRIVGRDPRIGGIAGCFGPGGQRSAHRCISTEGLSGGDSAEFLHDRFRRSVYGDVRKHGNGECHCGRTDGAGAV